MPTLIARYRAKLAKVEGRLTRLGWMDATGMTKRQFGHLLQQGHLVETGHLKKGVPEFAYIERT